MTIATNPQTGEVVYLTDDGKWEKATTAVNPQTKEMLAFDGKGWASVPAQSKGVLGYIDDAARSFASGATFGYADELAAKLDEITGRGGAYDENLKKEQARDAAIPAAIQIPGEVAGAVGSTIAAAPAAVAATPAKVAEFVKHLPAILRYFGLGAAEGAVAGSGNAEPGKRPEGAATGAAIGGPVGAAAPYAVQGATALARGIRNAVAPEAGAAADIGRAVVRDNMTPAQFADRAIAHQAERPGMATIADVGGENVRGLVERVAQTPGAGRTTVIPALTSRQEQQISRISDDLRELTGTSGTAVTALNNTIAQRQAAATPLYAQAYEAGDREIWSPTLERLSASPTVQRAMQGAVRVWRDNAIADGFGAMNPGALVERGVLKFQSGNIPVFPNVQFWDYTKRIVDDQVRAAERAGQDQKARTMSRLAQVLRTELDNVVPEYGAARQAWAGPSAYINSIENGRTILSKTVSAEEMSQAFRALSPSEQEGFRIGAVSAIQAKMGNDPAKLADLTKYLRAPEVRAKIAAIMPTPEAAEAWTRRLAFETQSSELVGRSLGNSATARRLAEQQDAKGLVGDLVMDALTAGPSSVSFLRQIVTAGPRWLRDTLRSRTDRQLADMLTNPDRVRDLPRVVNSAARAQGTVGSTRGAAGLTGAGVNFFQ